MNEQEGKGMKISATYLRDISSGAAYETRMIREAVEVNNSETLENLLARLQVRPEQVVELRVMRRFPVVVRVEKAGEGKP